MRNFAAVATNRVRHVEDLARATVSVAGRRYSIPRQATARQIWRRWYREQGKAGLIASLMSQRQGVFVDVGANWGQTLLDFVSAVSTRRYLGVEPNPECAAWLNSVIRRNALDEFEVIAAACGSEFGLARLHLFDDELLNASTLRPEIRPSAISRVRAVPVVTLDAISEHLLPDNVALVKIDVEGAEIDVLRGASSLLRSQRPPVICEVLHADADASMAQYEASLDRLERLLVDVDYVVHHLSGTTISAPLPKFPRRRWGDDSSGACDYLLAPSERVQDEP